MTAGRRFAQSEMTRTDRAAITDAQDVDHVLYRCAVCGSEDIIVWFATEFGSIGRCSACRQVLRAERPNRRAQIELHASSNIHEAPYVTLAGAASHELGCQLRFLDTCVRGRAAGTILDVGCGSGEFLRLATARGFNPIGIEPVAEVRTIARRNAPSARLEPTAVEDFVLEPESLDAVAMWDVIEHLIDPRGVLHLIHRWLRPGGYVGIATINHDSLMYVIYHLLRRTAPPIARPFGARLYNPFHTYYFSKKSLRTMVQGTGFTIVEHSGYEFPLSRLDASSFLKLGLRALYAMQWVCRMEGEQYLVARRPLIVAESTAGGT
jgi:2-polyprenyl-3-methyl-5-hydroxy-6-metoxy-1,4-benzoquinol methylase